MLRVDALSPFRVRVGKESLAFEARSAAAAWVEAWRAQILPAVNDVAVELAQAQEAMGDLVAALKTWHELLERVLHHAQALQNAMRLELHPRDRERAAELALLARECTITQEPAHPKTILSLLTFAARPLQPDHPRLRRPRARGDRTGADRPVPVDCEQRAPEHPAPLPIACRAGRDRTNYRHRSGLPDGRGESPGRTGCGDVERMGVRRVGAASRHEDEGLGDAITG